MSHSTWSHCYLFQGQFPSPRLPLCCCSEKGTVGVSIIETRVLQQKCRGGTHGRWGTLYRTYRHLSFLWILLLQEKKKVSDITSLVCATEHCMLKKQTQEQSLSTGCHYNEHLTPVTQHQEQSLYNNPLTPSTHFTSTLCISAVVNTGCEHVCI